MIRLVLTLLLCAGLLGGGYYAYTTLLVPSDVENYVKLVESDYREYEGLTDQLISYQFPLALEQNFWLNELNPDDWNNNSDLQEQLQLSQDFLNGGLPLLALEQGKQVTPSSSYAETENLETLLNNYYSDHDQLIQFFQNVRPYFDRLHLAFPYWLELIQPYEAHQESRVNYSQQENNLLLDWLREARDLRIDQLPQLQTELEALQRFSVPDELAAQHQATIRILQSYLNYQNSLQILYAESWEELAGISLEEVENQEIALRSTLLSEWSTTQAEASEEIDQLKTFIRDQKDQIQPQVQTINSEINRLKSE